MGQFTFDVGATLYDMEAQEQEWSTWDHGTKIEEVRPRSWLLTADLKSSVGSQACKTARRFKEAGGEVHALVWTPASWESARGFGELDPWEALWQLGPHCRSLHHVALDDLDLPPELTLRQYWPLLDSVIGGIRGEMLERIRTNTQPEGWNAGRFDPDRTLRPEVRRLIVEDRSLPHQRRAGSPDVHVLRLNARHRRRWPDSFFHELDLSLFPNLEEVEWSTYCGGLRLERDVLLAIEQLAKLGVPIRVTGDSRDLPEVTESMLDRLRAVAKNVEWVQ